MQNNLLKKNLNLFWDNALNLFCMSVLTGLFAGVLVTFYNILMSIGEHTAEDYYSLLLQNPAFIPLLFVGLAAGAVVLGTLVRFVPTIRGSGIPQIEGAARGVVRMKWYVTMCSMFAASLACVFMGYPAGAEGPSLELGGCCGSATGTLLRRNMMIKRLQIASGASAGLAVAFNAPITGVVFAMEEAFRSFSPQVFICATISVVTALFTRNAIRPAIGYSVDFAFTGFVFNDFDALSYLYIAVGAAVTALVGVGFYYSVFALKKVFRKITFFKGAGKYIIPFVLAGAFGLITLYSIGGGHSFIEIFATNGGENAITVKSVFGAGLILSLVIIVVIRFITAVMSMSCGVPCGVFIPMLAIGAGCGGVMSLLFQRAGMPAALSDYYIIICMAAFFTCVVKAPVTGIVMVFELTGSFTNFLPAILGVAIGYLVGMLFKTDAIYEKNLEGFIADEKLYKNFKKVSFTLIIRDNARIVGKAVRQVVWPANGLVISRTANGEQTVPDGETVLNGGETIVFECETDDVKELLQYLEYLVGKQENSASQLGESEKTKNL